MGQIAAVYAQDNRARYRAGPTGFRGARLIPLDTGLPNPVRDAFALDQPARILLDSHPALFQQVFAQIHGLLERVAIFAKFNSHVESLPNECRISVIFNGFRELSVVEGVCAVPCREEWLSRAEIRIVVGIKNMLLGEYLDLLRRPNRLLFAVVKSALDLPDSYEGAGLGMGEMRGE